MAADAFDVDDSGLDPLLVNFRAIAMLGQIAFGVCKMLQEFRLDILSGNLLGQLQGSSGVMNDLCRFQAGKFIEEPSTTGVHEQSVTLHFKKFKSGRLLVGLERANR